MSDSTEIKITELWEKEDVSIIKGNLRSKSSTISKQYLVENVDDELTAVRSAYFNAPKYIVDSNAREGNKNTIPRYRASIVERASASRAFKVQVEYSYNQQEDSDSGSSSGPKAEFSFEVSPSTYHVNMPVAQRCVYSSNAILLTPAQSINYPIGWNGEGGSRCEISGVDIPGAELREKFTKVFDKDTVTSIRWRRRIAELSFTVNINSFNGWEPGEVMFLGCTYNTPLGGVNTVSVDFNFHIRLNENTAYYAGKSIGKKLGHEYVWGLPIKKIPGLTTTSSFVEQRYVFCAQVVPYTNFNLLGL